MTNATIGVMSTESDHAAEIATTPIANVPGIDEDKIAIPIAHDKLAKAGISDEQARKALQSTSSGHGGSIGHEGPLNPSELDEVLDVAKDAVATGINRTVVVMIIVPVAILKRDESSRPRRPHAIQKFATGTASRMM